MRRAFRLAYDGTPYHGLQRQPDVRTIEDELFDALRALDVFEGETPAGYAAAGRTDAGVSALAQTVAFEAPDWLVPAALNAELPESIRAWAWADAPPEFHATHDARSREYTYHLHAPDADDDGVRVSLDRLAGTHDFQDLTPEGGDTVRTIHGTRTVRDGDFLVVTVRAGGFLRHLVRRIVSLIHEVGRGERELGFVDRALSSERLTGPAGIASAPPEPLVLSDVAYPDLDFAIDERAANSARETFETKRINRRTGARVVGAIRRGI